MQPLTFDQLHALPTTIDLVTAARSLGIGRTKAYQLARTGEFPCRIIRVGTGYLVPHGRAPQGARCHATGVARGRHEATTNDCLVAVTTAG